MILSPFSSARSTKPVRLVVVHTTEGASTVEALGAWFQKASTQASSHAGIDDSRVETYVPYTRSAWTLRTGNAISDNVELCGWARWTREDWLTHATMLNLTGAWIRGRCIARNIPIRKISPSDVAAGVAGVCGHVDWTRGMNDGTHTDPGDGFPWDLVINLAQNGTPVFPAPVSTTYCRFGDRSDNVTKLQKFMTSKFPSYNAYTPTGYYGTQTKAGMAEFQKRTGITGSDADGSIVGPRTMMQLVLYGFSG